MDRQHGVAIINIVDLHEDSSESLTNGEKSVSGLLMALKVI